MNALIQSNINLDWGKTLTPEQALACAIIQRAIADIVGDDVCSLSDSDRKTAWGFIFNVGRYRARDRYWNFDSLCDRIGLCPDYMRASLYKLFKTDRAEFAVRMKHLNGGRRSGRKDNGRNR